METADKTLTCRDCSKEFIFSAGEQEFYASRGLKNEPKRCPECRATRKTESQGATGERKVYNVVCASCGAETTVPFQPTEGRPVYCKDCYVKVRGIGK